MPQWSHSFITGHLLLHKAVTEAVVPYTRRTLTCLRGLNSGGLAKSPGRDTLLLERPLLLWRLLGGGFNSTSSGIIGAELERFMVVPCWFRRFAFCTAGGVAIVTMVYFVLYYVYEITTNQLGQTLGLTLELPVHLYSNTHLWKAICSSYFLDPNEGNCFHSFANSLAAKLARVGVAPPLAFN